MVNVDLVIKDKNNRLLLSWRDDINCGTGWHFIGGVLRLGETLIDRVHETTKKEIYSELIEVKKLIDVHEMIFPENKIRGHFVSFVYECFLENRDIILNQDKKPKQIGYLEWFEKCPNNLIRFQNRYRKYFV